MNFEEIDTTVQTLWRFDYDTNIKALPTEKQLEIAKRRSANLLSTLLHGEQGAMLICGQLVEVVPDMDGKLYAATQVIDEVRHVSYGLIYMKDAIPKMNERDRDRLEDFAWTAMTLLGSTPQMEGSMPWVDPVEELYGELGIDPKKANDEIAARMRDPEAVRKQPNPFRDHAFPQLQRIGLITDRTLAKYQAVGLAA